MKKIYVCHPLRGKVYENRTKVTAICQAIVNQHKDILPLSPIHNFSFLDPETYDANHGMELCFSLLGQADEIWIFGNWIESEGCRAELLWAYKNEICIRFMAFDNGRIIDLELDVDKRINQNRETA